MKALLSFEQAPPIDVPFRFLFSAVPFGIAAGLLLIFSGDSLASRWSPQSLALTHLFTVGFMLQAMSGAMLQLTPVAIGATISRPRLIASIAHPALLLGAASLVAGFLTGLGGLFELAIVALVTGIAVFAASTLSALVRTPARNDSRNAMLIALAGLLVTVTFGLALAAARSGLLVLPALLDTTTHMRFGWIGWGLALLCGASYLVVPMFQLTPQYPRAFQRLFAPGLLVALAAATLVLPEPAAGQLLALLAAVFAGMTLRLQHLRRRPRVDTSFRFWRVALLCTLAASALAAALPLAPDAGRLEVVIGILVLLGGFGSVICAMTYKIVPFLVWLHLNNAGAEALLMHQVIEEERMRIHLRAHVAALLAALGAPWVPVLSIVAGSLLAIAHGMQGANLLRAWSRYRSRRQGAAPVAAAQVR